MTMFKIVALVLFVTTHLHALLKNNYKLPLNNKYDYETKYFDAYIDHFNYVSSGKFKLRYLINEESFKPNGSILLYTGNEGDITTFAENTGFIWEAAKQLQSTVIFIEHRYYGTSMPFGDKSYQDKTKFGYMTAEQALADYAQLLTEMKKSEKYTNVPVIAMGGSYGGMLTAWMRQKYPNIIIGGLAASAPVFGFTGMRDCDMFNRIATRAYATSGSPDCPVKVREIWKKIATLATTSEGLEKLSTVFNTCSRLNSAESLVAFLDDFLGSVAMVNYPYPTDFLFDLPGKPLKQFCEILEGGGNDLLENFAKAFWSLFDAKRKLSCLDVSGSSVNAIDANGWALQTCMEMTIPMCSNGVDDMFPAMKWDDKEYSDQCFQAFGVRPRTHRAQTEWWGEDANDSLDNIIYSNGDLDPWSGLGVNETTKLKRSYYFRLPNGAHHLDLRETNAADPEDVTKAREAYMTIFKLWIKDHYKKISL